jgi:hypothetical protein
MAVFQIIFDVLNAECAMGFGMNFEFSYKPEYRILGAHVSKTD